MEIVDWSKRKTKIAKAAMNVDYWHLKSHNKKQILQERCIVEKDRLWDALLIDLTWDIQREGVVNSRE